MFDFLPLVFGIDDMALVAILSIIGSAVSAGMQNKNNKDIMQSQQAWNEQMMDKQNEYNLPENQMKRLQDAGVNPVVGTMSNGSIMGGVSASVNPSSVIGSVDPLSSASNNLLSMMNAFKSKQEGSDVKSTRQARIDNIIAQNDQLKANASLLGAKATEQDIINRYADAREMFAREGDKANIHLTYAQSAVAIRQVKRMDYELSNILPEQLKILVNEGKLQVLDMDKVIAEIADLRASASLKSSNKGLVESQIENTQMDTALKGEQRSLTEQESAYYSEIQEKYLEKFDAEIKKLASESNLTDEQAFWYCIKLQADVLDNSVWSTNKRKGLSEDIKSVKTSRPSYKNGMRYSTGK